MVEKDYFMLILKFITMVFRLVSTILLPILVVFSSCQSKESSMKLVWSDEFDYEGAPNPDLWEYDEGNGCPSFCGWGNNELQYYTNNEKNVRVADGKLIIEAHKENYEESGYTSAKIKSNNSAWQYAYIEIKAKLPSGRGTWPAVWMMPETSIYGGWPKSGEIDIMEHVGYDPGVVHGTVHTEAFNHSIGTQVGKQTMVPDFDTDFHVYAMNWTENQIEFFVDGVKYQEFKNNGDGPAAWPFDHPFYLILNVAVGGNWGGAEGVDDAIWPQRMEVDYVRVYEPLAPRDTE